jgi:hypothetical protein
LKHVSDSHFEEEDEEGSHLSRNRKRRNNKHKESQW